MLDGDHRVRGAVDNERRRGDQGPRRVWGVALGERVVVPARGEVARALDVVADEVERVRLTEGAPVSREHSGVADHVVDDRVPV